MATQNSVLSHPCNDLQLEPPSGLKDAGDFISTGAVDWYPVLGERLAVWHTLSSKPAVPDSPVIVFIHGNSASKEVFYRQIPYFHGLGYDLVAIDLPGHGQSDNALAPDTTYTIPGYARCISTLLTNMEIVRPVVVGWSLGGHIAIEMIGQGLDVAGLCLTGTPPMGPGLEDFPKAFLPSPSALVTTQAVPTHEELTAYASDLYGSTNLIPPYFFAMAARADGAARANMGTHWASGEEGCSQKQVVNDSRVLKLVVHGMKDVFISYDYLQGVNWTHLYKGEIIEFPDQGHAPFFENASQFNKILAEFLQQLDV